MIKSFLSEERLNHIWYVSLDPYNTSQWQKIVIGGFSKNPDECIFMEITYFHPVHGWDTTAPWYPCASGPIPGDVLEAIENFLRESTQ